MAASTKLDIEGMTCSNCALGISYYLEKKGLKNVDVNFATGEVVFDLNESATVDELRSGIEGLGYKVVASADGHQGHSHNSSPLEKKFILSVVLSLPLLLHMVSDFWLLHDPLFQFVLCTPVFLIGVFHFGRSALASLRTGIPNMDVLIFTGTTAAYFYSIAGWALHHGTPLVHHYLFFETTAVIITLVLLGNILEARAVKRTTSAIKDLTKLQQTTARRILNLGQKNETIEDADYTQLKAGNILMINEGDKVPADCIIERGQCRVDESMITGESEPLERSKGQRVIGGTLLLSGNIRATVEKAGDETVLSGIIRMVKEAQRSKPAIQKLGDQVSAVFVPVVIGIAAITFLVTYFVFDTSMGKALMHSIAVLVISCPCAMGLATPTAVMVGIGRAARQGLLIKGGSTLEQLAKIKTVVFDKTGTLTTGDFEVRNLQTFGITKEDAFAILNHIELHSSHPIAKALVKHTANDVNSQSFENWNTQEVKGGGMNTTDPEGNNYLLGSAKFTSQKIGSKDIYLTKNQTVVAAFDIVDEIKADAVSMIAELQQMNMKLVMLSGDKEIKCRQVAKQLGITEVYSEQNPEDKLALVKKLSNESPTAMVGDGINDAPALAQATIGISLSKATQVAIQSAQVVVMSQHSLARVADAFLLGRHSLLTIKQNLFWAFFYNVLAIPIAAMGFLSPMIAALSMAFSDVVVVGNSIRLRTKSIR